VLLQAPKRAAAIIGAKTCPNSGLAARPPSRITAGDFWAKTCPKIATLKRLASPSTSQPRLKKAAV